MKKLVLGILLILATACDDGDFNTPSFDFSSETIKISYCGELVFYKLNSNQQESLILNLKDETNTDNSFFKTEFTKQYTITETGTNTFLYRIFNGKVSSTYFCNDVPPTSPIVSSEWFGNGTLTIANTITLDDEDKVPSAIEGLTLDTDGDGYPNYIDTDDDGDNITTINEDLNKDGDPTNDDTDGDGIPNYLDNDDDNDGVLSVNESKTADENNNGIVDYLDPATTSFLAATTTPVNKYKKKYSMTLKFSTLDLTNTESSFKYIDGYTVGTLTGSFEISDLPTTSN